MHNILQQFLYRSPKIYLLINGRNIEMKTFCSILLIVMLVGSAISSITSAHTQPVTLKEMHQPNYLFEYHTIIA